MVQAVDSVIGRELENEAFGCLATRGCILEVESLKAGLGRTANILKVAHGTEVVALIFVSLVLSVDDATAHFSPENWRRCINDGDLRGSLTPSLAQLDVSTIGEGVIREDCDVKGTRSRCIQIEGIAGWSTCRCWRSYC